MSCLFYCHFQTVFEAQATSCAVNIWVKTEGAPFRPVTFIYYQNLRMSEGTLLPIRLQVLLHNYVKFEAPRKLYTKLGMKLKVASCLFVGKGSSSSSSSRTGCVVPDCGDRRTGSVGRWQLKWLVKQLFGLGLDSNCTSLRNGSFHDVSFLCTKPLIIFLLQQDYPTHCKSVIECLY